LRAQLLTPRLAEGGKIKGPLTSQSGTGYLLDKFGINWVVSVDKA
jgi:uncharacterized glyoxalase superfamily protein PhnB